MILYPECQARAQAEIDIVIGPDRLPEFSDRVSLLYVERLLQETLRYGLRFLVVPDLISLLRWHQATPLGACLARMPRDGINTAD